MNTRSPQVTDLGVYRIDHEDRNPTFLVALKNDDEGDYSFALAPAVAIPGARFTYNDSEILVFLSTDPKDRIYTTYDDSEGLYDQRPASDLINTAFLAITPDELLRDTALPQKSFAEKDASSWRID
ncbi:MAG: hypothetical protein ACREBG_24920 [Pyrinomonadaceae bacterium]